MKSKPIPFYGYRIAMVLLSLCFYPNLLQAKSQEEDSKIIYQNKITITGVVSDESGVLPGVIVHDKASNNSTLTDADGNYSIQIKPGDILEFSYIGYTSKKIVITNQKTLNITLDQDTQQLDEIVVNAGYYTVKDRERTGSIARVTAKDIEHQPVLNPLQAIQGRMAGVDIAQASGVPGSTFHIEIRGRNGFNRLANAPLYVIDGVVIPTSNLDPSPLSNSILPYTEINLLNSLNPSDIETIEILKDADATAIYGSRGANGVVLITTKKGKSDTLSVTISSATSFSKVARKMKLLNSNQFVKFRELAFQNDQISDYPSNAFDLNGTWDKYRSTDWQKELIGGTAQNQTYQIGISGGSSNTKFSANYNHNEQTTVFPTDKGYKRNTFLININHNSIDNKFFINSSTNLSLQSNNLIGSDLTNKALTLAPNAPSLYNEDGTKNWDFQDGKSPISSLDETYQNENDFLLLNVTTGYELLQDLIIKINANYTKNTTEEWRLTPHTTLSPYLNYTSKNSKSAYTIRHSKTYGIEPQINYSNTAIDKLTFQSLIGLTYQESETGAIYLTGSDFQTNDFIKNIAAANNKTIEQSANLQYKYFAIFARMNFDFNKKYLINLTARRDGSSRFGTNQKFGNFAALGFAWIFTNEDFFKHTKSWLTYGKLRSSYGTTGSDNIGDYQYLDTYETTVYHYDGISALAPARLHNPNFSWEKTKKTEIALDLSLFNDRVQLELAWYRNTSSNQLIGIQLPETTGFTSIQDNLAAKVENKGWELSLNTTNINNSNFSWFTNFNISFPKNKLLAFPNLEGSTYSNTYIIGKSTNVLQLLNFEGIDSSTGEYIFTDYTNDNIINTNDNKSIIELEKKFYGGLQNSFNYKKFSLDIFLQFVKQNGYNYNRNMNIPGSLYNFPIEILNNWTPENQQSYYGKLTGIGNNTMITNFNNFKRSNAIISDASYIRIKNISLSYLVNTSTRKSLKIYLQANNLFTITNYFGLDPEISSTNTLPPLRTFTLGAQLTF